MNKMKYFQHFITDVIWVFSLYSQYSNIYNENSLYMFICGHTKQMIMKIS